jgi:heme/copper-type cytochrome/quinol oxidase subunit 1
VGKDLSGLPEKPSLSKLTVILLLLGGYGFLSMFYWAGAHSVPRRYAIYPSEVAQGTLYARIAFGFITVLLCGILLYLWETGKRCLKAFHA